MNTLVLFDQTKCVEFSQASPPDGFSLPTDLKPNIPHYYENGQIVLFAQAEAQDFSIIGIRPLRIGTSPHDHIQVNDTNACITLEDETLTVINAEALYLNGKKIDCGEYRISIGDRIWVGSTRIDFNTEHVKCAGMHYSSSLNISATIPKTYEEFPIYKRSPRIIKREPTDTIELSEPKKKEEHRKGELLRLIIPPLAMSSVMVGGSLLMGRGLFVLISAAAMLVSVVFSVSMFFSDRKTKRRKEKMRDEAYEDYLLTKRKQIHKMYEVQKESLLYHNLSPKEIESEILSNSSRVYERAANDNDFLTLSLGYGTVPTSYKLNYKADKEADEQDHLADEMRAIGAAYQSVSNMPTIIDLKQAHLGLVGDKAYIHRKLFAILSQLCFFQSYHDIEIVLLVEEEDRSKFEWARWYPHCRIKSINVTGLVSAENQRDQVLGNMAQVLKMRRQKQDEEKKDSRFLPHYIFIVDNPKLIINHSIMEYLQTPETSLGFSVIYTTHIQSNLPEYVRTVFLLIGGDQGMLILNEGQLLNRPVTLPSMQGIDLETIARKLAPLKHTQGVSTQIPEAITFFELYNVKRPEEIPVLDLWAKNACHKSLAVPLGVRGKDDIVLLNLHEKAHGPHGLVAGTTGSGKSEIVQSYILSLAVNFHPHEVGFLLIDYKGGGMANLFSNLPHLLGTITNLDGSESMRALASIKSELQHRQRIFGEHGVNNINQYTKLFTAGEASLPLPHLFIISDEFAELKKEQPDFMAELVSTARIGRSLGVHLILATQKPSGVVDDQIWSNSKFKLALKVANEGDSNEVLKTPDAARITQPGRAYLQVGNNEVYELFQSAWSGAPYSEDVVERGFDSRVYLINQLGQGVLLNDDLSVVDVADETNLTQLDVTVSHVLNLYKGLGAVQVNKPWLPPLSTHLVTNSVQADKDVGVIDTYNLSVPLAMVDIPDEQRQVEYSLSFPDDGNLAVIGASGSGKSTLLMTTALTLACRNSPRLLNFFIMDYGNSALVGLRGLPHTADYLGLDDTEKLDKLVKLLTEELKKRKYLFATVNAMNFRMYNELAAEKLPALIIFIDNSDVIREIDPELEDFLAKLTRDGVGVGIYTVITATRPTAVRFSVMSNFKNKIAQFMTEKSDVSSVVGRSDYDLPEIQGRAMIRLKDAHVAQCYLPVPFEDDISYAKQISEIVSEISKNNSAPSATGIRVVPETVTFADITPLLKLQERQAVLGFDIESTEPLYLDLSIPNHLVVSAPTIGKTNILKIILTQYRGSKCFVIDSRAGDLRDFDGKPEVFYASTESRIDDFCKEFSAEVERREKEYADSGLRAKEFCATQPLVLVAIDDADNFIDLSKNKAAEIEKLISTAMELGIAFIVTSLPSKLKGFDNITKLLRNAQAGIVLGSPADQSLLPVPPPRGYKPLPDIGFWYKRGDIRQVKLPFMG